MTAWTPPAAARSSGNPSASCAATCVTALSGSCTRPAPRNRPRQPRPTPTATDHRAARSDRAGSRVPPRNPGSTDPRPGAAGIRETAPASRRSRRRSAPARGSWLAPRHRRPPAPAGRSLVAGPFSRADIGHHLGYRSRTLRSHGRLSRLRRLSETASLAAIPVDLKNSAEIDGRVAGSRLGRPQLTSEDRSF